MKKKKIITLLFLALLISFILTGCIPADGKNTLENPAGFFWGVWHGWIAPISLILEIFGKNTRIYEVANNGLAYDIGFYISIISGFGSLSLFRNRKKCKNDK